MALPSTYQLQHSLPNRSPSHRPRSLSLSEYQPVNFDREALESAYQASLNLPSSSASYRSYPSQTSLGGSETHDTFSAGHSSVLSQNLRSGDNPHARSDFNIKPPPVGNFAGVGAGHTLTPPGSPFHAAAQQVHQQALLSPVPASPLPPTPPARPTDLPPSTFAPGPGKQPQRPPPLPQRVHPPPMIMRRSQSDTNVNRDQPWQGQQEWIEGDGHGRGKRRALPAPPLNVPVPEPPAWEPDYKPQIPTDLTAPSAAHAYASLSAPPPNLPPRRGQTSRATSQIPPPPPIQSNPYDASSSTAAGPSGTHETGSSSTSHSTEPIQPPPGAPDFPPTVNEAERTPVKPPRDAEKEVFLRSTDKTPIWSTHYLDPSLRESLVHIPHHVTNIANVALSGLSSGPKAKYNSTIGAPIDGLARAAKDWAVSPDGRFVSEHGGVELGLGVINSGGTGWGKDKGRKRARVEVVSKSGGIRVDVIEIDEDRQLDLRIDTKSGDVLVLLPETFHGPIHITCYNRAPEFLPILSPQLAPLANPYSSLYSTFMTPLHLSRDPNHTRSAEHNAARNVERYVPASFREQSDMLDQVAGGYTNHSRGEHSKLNIRSEKGRVVIGMRESKDDEVVKSLGLRVGVMEGGKKGKKRWWLP